MLVLLPPSETKSVGGEAPPLAFDRLSWPELTESRVRTARLLGQVSGKPRAGLTALGLTQGQSGELRQNLELRTSATMPAIERYTGVLYDALDIRSLTAAQRRTADARLAIGSALFGLIRAGDLIPAYRLSASSRLPRVRSLSAMWRACVGPLLENLADEGIVVDLRSGAYQSLAPLPRALTIRVVSEREGGMRAVVSHFNKASKGSIARELAVASHEPRSAEEVAELLVGAGWDVEWRSARQLDVVLQT